MPGRLPALLFLLILFGPFVGWSQLYIAPNGNDTNAGTPDKPKATLSAALRQVREMRRLNNPLVKDGIHIILKGGLYQLNEPVFIRPEDAGTATSPTIIEAAPNEQPVLSGGVHITGWKKIAASVEGLPKEAKGKVWVADVPTPGGDMFNFRQLWVNNVKAIRAKDTDIDSMSRILSWNKATEQCWIPKPKTSDITKAVGMEMFIHQWWAIAILRIKSVEVKGDSARLSFYQPESRVQSEHPWPAPWISKETGNSAYYLTNAIQFLNQPGEWFLDRKAQKLYYWPRDNENLVTAVVTAPYLETLVKVEGTVDHPVSNISFKGISFQHTGWLRPSQKGHVPHQTGMYMTEAYRLKPAGTKEKPGLDNQAWIGRPSAAVQLNYATNTSFENCRFEHLASTGLDYNKAVHANTVKGNLFKDIGGTSILAGVFSEEAQEIHSAYQPKDEREVCDSMIVTNNLVTDGTNEDWSCTGIAAGYVRNTTIEYNEVENVSYSGISVGWGWNPAPNPMKNNRIFGDKINHYGKHNYDCAGIYTLSAQPNSLIAENYIDSIYKAPYSHLPSHWFYLYTDEGSSYFTVKNNWTPSTKYLQNANGSGNVWENNGKQVDIAIKQKAGLQQAYQYLTKERTSSLVKQPINEEHNEVIELVVKQGQQLNLSKLKQLLAQNKMDSTAIYQWQNHYVIFDKVVDIGVMQGRLQNNFPEATVRVYHDMFYQYSKKKHCTDTATARQWDHILLTANLVADEQKQQAYLQTHATQFDKLPQIAKGFCNANFQELLLFKNGRQLMLVISIPKGESLNKLNPKTTENNPTMISWNKQMGQYQEGIKGTRKGETWVFLKQL